MWDETSFGSSDEDEDQNDGSRSNLSKKGISFTAASSESNKNEEKNEDRPRFSSNSRNHSGNNSLPNQNGNLFPFPLSSADKKEGKESEKEVKGYGFFSGKQKKKEIDPNIGNWERNTKGIGSKLLSKMGWKAGEGLGKDKSGINRPIDVKLRKKGEGLGFSGSERTKQQIEDFPSEQDVIDKNKEEEKKLFGREQNWKKGRKEKTKYSFEPIEEKKNANAGPIHIKDMTGETVKMVDSSQVNTNSGPSVTSNYMPDLQFNIKLLVDLEESKLVNLDSERSKTLRRMEENKAEYLKLSERMKTEEEKKERLGQVIKLFKTCRKKFRTRKSLWTPSLKFSY
eukprot:TRINITY_DN4470_c0_g1_i1.p1 TRINITY_DN4470_c0_g1~~TRINITY_DN4470_c0_g1_i1.p1  ORF type:complete len:372 (-),score=154.57 TRINITY_DN4470_c0_g1_i1:978-1997(-)